MKTQRIGKSALVSSRLAFGCMRIAGDEAGVRSVMAAYEAGYTHFDHADIYGNGVSEEVFGRVLKEVPGMRDRVLIASKCGIRWKGEPDASAPHRYDFARAHILKSCDASLLRLGTDRIDLYMLHRPDYLADPQEVAAAFTELKRQGKVLEFGVSNFRPSQLAMIQRACPMPLVAHQVEIHPGRLDCFEDGTLDQCLEHDVTPVSWSPLGGGRFGDGGGVDPNDPQAAGQRALLEVLDTSARQHGVSRTVIVLAWLMRHPSRIIPIVGSTSPERIRDAARADDVEMGREEWYSILLAARGRGLA